MTEYSIARTTGLGALACVVFSWAQFPLWMIGNPASVYDGQGFADHLFRIRHVALTRIAFDQCIYVGMMVFAAGFRHLFKQAKPECEWLGTLAFGAASVWLAVTLVADGLEGGAVLDTLPGQPDPSVVRALVLGTILIYNGSIAFAITGLFLFPAGWATLESGVLPRWTGWLAHAAAGLCAISVPAMYMGPVDSNGFYNAGAGGPPSWRTSRRCSGSSPWASCCFGNRGNPLASPPWQLKCNLNREPPDRCVPRRDRAGFWKGQGNENFN